MTRERFPYLHDLLASTANQDEIEIWESLDSRLSHWQGRNWRQDTKMIWALGSEASAEFYVGPLLLKLAKIDQP